MHSPDHVTGKTWTSTVDIMQNTAVLKYAIPHAHFCTPWV